MLSWRVRGGVIFAPTVDVATQSGNFVPPEQRFYGGGPNDVRGYQRNELGPVVYVVLESDLDSTPSRGELPQSGPVTVAATGGNTLAWATWSCGFRSRLSVSASGSRRSWTSVASGSGGPPSSTPVIRVTPGAGLRINTPLGPARLDVAYNPYRSSRRRCTRWTPGRAHPVPGQENVRSRSE